jgi:hypothetical protein
MSHSKHNGKARRRVRKRADTIGLAVACRHVRGSTEKILRRNRKLWVRLGNKRRRQHDKDTVAPPS